MTDMTDTTLDTALLDAAKVKAPTVLDTGTGRSTLGITQAHSARAWTSKGDVD